MPWLRKLAGIGGLPPCGGGVFVCGHDPVKCRAEARTLPDGPVRDDGTQRQVAWPTCPVRWALDDQGVGLVMRLHRDARAGFPTTRRLAPWVIDALQVYVDAIAETKE